MVTGYELRDERPVATPESVAERFATLWGGTLEWVSRPVRFRLGRTVYRVVFWDGAYEVRAEGN